MVRKVFHLACREYIAGMIWTTQSMTVGQSTVQMITTWLAVVVSFYPFIRLSVWWVFNVKRTLVIKQDLCRTVYCKIKLPLVSEKEGDICPELITVYACMYIRCLNVRVSGELCVVAGLEMAWVQRPPEKVTNGEEFNVSYTVTASDSFYEYAVRNRIFQFRWVFYINTWNSKRLPFP